MSDEGELVVVRSFSHPHEAHLACSALHAAGVEAAVADSHIVAADWLVSNAVGGVKVVVRQEDAAQAREILETAAVVEDAIAESGAPNDDVAARCARCGSEDVIRVAHGRRC
jgi:putative signal transducing protein